MNLNIDTYITRTLQQSTGKLWVISGPSGVGKGTLVKEVLSQLPQVALSVSMTTRAPRLGEEEGQNYFFRSREDFETMIEKEAFLEYAQYNSNYYGTPVRFVQEQLEQGLDVILEIEVQGGAQVRAKLPEQALGIFILPPSQAALETRLRNRKTESEAVIQQRLARVEEELTYFSDYDYCIINDDLTTATQDLKSIIQAERLKLKPRRMP